LVVFAAAVTFGPVLLFGLFPAIYTTRPNLASALKRQAGQPSGSRTAKRFRASLATAQMALSMALLAAAGLFAKSLTKISYYVRTSLDPEQFLATVPRIVARLDPNLPVTDLRTMPQQVRENVFLDRFIGVLAATFAGLATLLAAVGLYGVLAYAVAQRTREIGLRMALGAAPSRVRAMILRQVAAMAAIGGTIGLVGAVGIERLAESML
jgi:ABC-type antimicrobial peptide transport system permease subunit